MTTRREFMKSAAVLVALAVPVLPNFIFGAPEPLTMVSKHDSQKALRSFSYLRMSMDGHDFGGLDDCWGSLIRRESEPVYIVHVQLDQPIPLDDVHAVGIQLCEGPHCIEIEIDTVGSKTDHIAFRDAWLFSSDVGCAQGEDQIRGFTFFARAETTGRMV